MISFHNDMDNLRDVVMKAVIELQQALQPLQEQDNRISLQMNHDNNLAENLAHLGALDALIQPRMEAISRQKELVDAATSGGKTKDLVIAFFYLVKTLQSDCRKLGEDFRKWDEIFNEIDALRKQKEQLFKREGDSTEEILQLKVKDDMRKDLLKLAWNVMSDEIKSSRKESSAPEGDLTDTH
ncbi:hypothetical protein SLS63_011802 [Diaporthe eres]|uniref:Uncharacterized protein n=1 Tax=Diaporthe eres TaxID=83184 RepID=A0ABR1NT65_DIAER